ncbi:MAG TPA: hypothetical protein VM639_10235 [Dongiaceae bacterium]|nr:hypothetical protein [Dongiaceae bacterium]
MKEKSHRRVTPEDEERGTAIRRPRVEKPDEKPPVTGNAGEDLKQGADARAEAARTKDD